ncbi:MAG TPA: PAS domain S-box protein [Sedimentisphaerales bacterium]|nr:PAS domain S-box protein [Sedimentisphaerales bacterium]
MVDSKKTRKEPVEEIQALWRAQEELRKGEEIYRALFVTNPDGIIVRDMEGKLLDANKAFADMLGYTIEELRGKTYKQITPRKWHKIEADIIKNQILAKGFSEAYEKEYIRKDGSIFPVAVRVNTTKDRQDKPVIAWSFVRDITELKEAEEQLIKTQERVEYILATSPATTYTSEIGSNWAATFISENVRNQFAYEPNQFVEDPNFWVEHIHPDDRQRIIAGLSRIFEDNFNIHEYRFLHKDGSYRWVHDESRLIRDEQGKPLECIGYWTDITERKKAEEEIKKFKKMTDLAPHGCAIADLDGNLTYINDNFARMHGYASAELIGKNLEIFHTDAQMKRVSELNKRLIEKGQGIHGEEVWHVHRDGTEFPTLMSDWVMRDDNGNPSLMCATAIDITELKLMEQHEREHREEIAHFARLSTIGEMSSALAHELNQPLCAIVTYAEGALRMMKSGDWDSNELLEAIQEAGIQAERAGKIIRRIANLVRKKEPHRSGVSIGEIIGETIKLLEYEARLKGITIQWIKPSEKSPMLKVDRIQIQQVLVNLLHNSFEAMKNLDQSKRQIIIEVSTDENDMVQVVVSDTGCGLSAESTDRIFKPFFTTNSQGLGMGLSISRSIIEAHGGRIWAESNPAGGATFRFTLPM